MQCTKETEELLMDAVDKALWTPTNKQINKGDFCNKIHILDI